MSSYLNFYLVPEKEFNEEQKPMMLMSFSRNSSIYTAFYENMDVAYIGNDDVPKYSELTKDIMSNVIQQVTEYIDSVQTKFNHRMDAYKALPKLEGEVLRDYTEDYVSTESYLAEERNSLQQLYLINTIVHDLEYSNFEKVLINID